MTEYRALDAFAGAVEELQARVAMQDGVLKDFANNFDCDSDAHKYGTACRACEAQKVRQATSEDVAAWQEKQLAPLRREVMALYHYMRALQTVKVSNGDRVEYPLFSSVEDVMRNVKSTAEAYEKEVAAKAKIEALETFFAEVNTPDATAVSLLIDLSYRIEALRPQLKEGEKK